ncbi:MAG TPA: type II toxin-antitoxin system VapB family antitoxin [Gemmatimonadales bacterium]|jgi:Arc/MetJ family transcription regulator
MTTRKPSGPKRRSLPRSGRGRKKTLLLDQELLDRARQALGVRTETDAVTRALEAVVRRQQQVEGIRLLASLGPIDVTRID